MDIKCEKICKNIKGIDVLKDIDLHFESGKVYGLWGKNGCGKTMLMRLMCRLIQPTSGILTINGQVVSSKNAYPVRVGALIETPSFIDEYTGLKNLEILASIQGLIDERQIRETMQKIGLDPDDRRIYKKYSLGMKQRLGIACAIMEKPELVLLDEPINAIDEDGVRMVRTIFTELKNENSLIIVACHDKEEMKMLADEVIIMENGRSVGQIRNEDF